MFQRKARLNVSPKRLMQYIVRCTGSTGSTSISTAVESIVQSVNIFFLSRSECY